MNQFIQPPLPNYKIDKLISHQDLLEKIREDYDVGNYESSITKAFKYLEETVILSAYPSENLNVKSKNLDEKTANELKTLQVRKLGALQLIQNLKNGDNESKDIVISVLQFVDSHLKILFQPKN